MKKRTIVSHLLFFLPTFTLAMPGYASLNETELKIGVRAINGVDNAKRQWAETTRVLSEKIDGYHFTLIPVIDFNEMRIKVKNKQIDFVLTNPLAYVDLKQHFGIKPILTLNKKQPNGIASTLFSSAIITHTDNTNINQLSDLKDLIIMGVHPEAFGGWQMAFHEMLRQDIDPFEQSVVKFSHDNLHVTVLKAVLNKEVDAGIIRSGILENHIAAKKIDPGMIKIINQHHDDLPVLHSTAHYPEWPFAALDHIDPDLTDKVFRALISITPESKAATSGHYINWTRALDYQPVTKMTYDIKYRHLSFEHFVNEYQTQLIFSLLFLLSSIVYVAYLRSINKKLSLSEADLQNHKDNLESLVEARTLELKEEIELHEQTEARLADAKAAADQANQAKSEFLAQMSHEIRTPLNAILGFGQLVKMDAKKDTELYDNTCEILSAGQHLLSLTNEVLDLSKIESGKLETHCETVNLSDTVEECVALTYPLADKKNITIRQLSCDRCHILADKKRLKQVCINILSNAIKYNKENGQIDISLKDNKTMCQLIIKDTGIGIKKEFHDSLFSPFVRAKEDQPSTEGTGIGLTISKKLVESMKGTIEFSSEYGKGSEFRISLPAQEDALKSSN